MRLIVFIYTLLLSVLAITVQGFEPKVSVSEFKTSPQSLLYFQDSSVVLYLAGGEDDDGGPVYRSDTDGEAWKEVKFPGQKNGNIKYLIEHPHDSKIAYALTSTQKHYVTLDQGANWKEFSVPLTRFNGNFPPLAFHCDKPGYVIMSGAECPNGDASSPQCIESVYFTQDSFQSAQKLVNQRAYKCIWGHSNMDSADTISEDAVLCLVESDNTRKLSLSTDFFRSSEFVHVDGESLTAVIDFGAMSKFFIVATQHKVTNSDQVLLLTSSDLTKWRFASFPGDDGKDITETSFTILESSKHSLHVDVTTSKGGRSEGTLYTSNSNGDFFQKSLERTSRSRGGLVDLEKLEGIDGILISNVLENGGGNGSIRTKISYDDGRTWNYLTVADCRSADAGCNLNLHAILDHKNLGRIFSSPSPGIIAGIGNTGRRLKDCKDGDLYLSGDSGLTWTKASNGPHFYEFGDQGNVLLAIQDKDDSETVETDEIKVSFDRGTTWETFRLKSKVAPRYLLTTPDSTSMKFLLFGSSQGKPVSVAINFEGIFRSKCIMKEDGSGDFEKWYARYDAQTKQPSCIMGHKQFFWRKRIDAGCYVSDLYHEQFASTEDCPCTQNDYECDLNFVISPHGQKKCVPSYQLQNELAQCKIGEKYERSTGYTLVPGNTCKKDGPDSVVLDGTTSIICGSETKDNNDDNDDGSNGGEKSDGNVTSHRFLFDGQIANYFYLKSDTNFPDDETVIVRNNYDQAFITHDQGTTWVPLLEHGEILSLVSNPNFPNTLYALTTDRKLHVSEDRGHSFKVVNLPATPGPQIMFSLEFHQKNRDWLIFIGERGCDNPFSCKLESFYSTDGGDSWHDLQEDVTRCTWISNLLHPTDEKLIFCDKLVADGLGVRKSLISSKDFFKTQTTHFDRIIGYALQSEFIVVATVSIICPWRLPTALFASDGCLQTLSQKIILV